MVEGNDIKEHPIPGGMVLFFLLGSIVLSILLSFLVLLPLSWIKGIPMSDLASNLTLDSSVSDRNFSRLLIFINHLFTFIIPSILVAFFIYKNEWYKALGLKKIRRALNPLLGGVFIVLSIPASILLYLLNQKIPLPEFLQNLETGTNELIQAILIADSNIEIVINVLIIAVLPAIGEELCFRGMIQRQLGSIFSNHHIAILISAIIFSAFHMQFQGFLPRFFLGGLLGYLFYWTGNIWVPIFGHFAHNAFQVLGVYFSGENIRELDISVIELPATPQLVIFIALAILVGYYIYQINRGNQLSIIKS